MEPEGSSPRSQQPVTCPYPDADKSNPLSSIVFSQQNLKNYY